MKHGCMKFVAVCAASGIQKAGTENTYRREVNLREIERKPNWQCVCVCVCVCMCVREREGE